MKNIKKILIYLIALIMPILLYGEVFAEEKSGKESFRYSLERLYGDTSGFENQNFEQFYNDMNPLLREYYGGYQRSGNFKILKGNGQVINSTGILVKWENQGTSPTTQYYKVGDNYIKKNIGEISREINKYTRRNFYLSKKVNLVYSEPFDEKVIKGKKVEAGTYKTTQCSLDFVEIELADGSKVWVNPQYTPGFEKSKNGYFVESKDYLNVSDINGVPIKKMIMPVAEDKRTGIAMNPQYVTIHNTGNKDAGANAERHAIGQYNGNNSYVSWHFTVDQNNIYQSMPMNEIGWHAGDGLNNGNGTSIGIEICQNSDGNYAIAEKNAALLTARILYENNLPYDAIRMHKDWSGKDCPENIIHGYSGTMGWTKFKEVVKNEYNRLDSLYSAKSVTINYTSKNINLGDSYTFKANVIPYTASQKVTWRVGNKEIASVDNSGKVKGLKAGNTWLYAKTQNGKEAKCLIKIIVPAKSIKFNQSEKKITLGTSSSIKVLTDPVSASDFVSWRTGNSSIATVNKNGILKANSVGNTWLYAKSINGLEAKCLIRVVPAANTISIDYSTKEVELGKSIVFKAQIEPVNALQNVTWRTGNSKVAKVDNKGKVTAVGIGNTWLYARSENGKETRCLIKVVIPANSLNFKEDVMYVSNGKTKKAEVLTSPIEASGYLKWRTGNAKIATVSSDGTVKGNSLGNTWLYAKSINGNEIKCLIKVVSPTKEIRLNYTEKEIKIKQKLEFKAEVFPSTANQNLKWKIGNSNKAIVNNNGVVTGIAEGNTWLYAISDDGIMAKCLIKVK